MADSSWFRHIWDTLRGNTPPLSQENIPSRDVSALQQPIASPPGTRLLYTLEECHMERLEGRVVWSPDGKLLASSSGSDSRIWLWDASNGALLRTLENRADTGRKWALAWSPDGKLLTSGSDNRICLWDASNGVLLRTLEHSMGGRTVIWSPNGKLLASASLWAVKLWDPSSGALLRTLSSYGIRSVAWSPDSRLLASTSYHAVKLWDPSNATLLDTLDYDTRDSVVLDVAWSPDGRLLAAGSQDATLRLWDVRNNGVLSRTLKLHEGDDYDENYWVEFIKWSPDGRLLATTLFHNCGGCPHSIHIWSTDTWKLLVLLSGLEDHFPCDWHPHLPILVTPGQGSEKPSIWSLDLKYLLQVAPSETVRYTNAKVVLVGDSGVGKSGLALVLTGQSFAPTYSTHGRRVWLLDQQEVQAKGGYRKRREVWLWDLAGQRDYRLIHQLHLHEATVALIVCDAADDTDSFAVISHWYRALRQSRRDLGSAALPLTILLVVARIDTGTWRMSYVHLDSLAQKLDCAGYIETSAKDGRGIAALRQAILAAIDWDRLPEVTLTPILQAIKAFMLREQHAGRFLHTIDDLYKAFLHTNDDPPSSELRREFETTLGRLEVQGVIRRLCFGDLVLLQPELLDAYASALLIAVKDEPDGLGCILETHVQQGLFSIPPEDRLPNPLQEQLLLIVMIEELIRYELALRESGFLLFPSQSTRKHPNYLAIEEQQTAIFTIAGPILSLYTTLVVRLAQCGIFQKQDLWQHVVTYTTQLGGTYGLRLSFNSDEQADLGLFFDTQALKEMRFCFEDFVRTHLEKRTSGTVQQRRRFVCSACGKVFSEKDTAYRKSHGFTFIKCICDMDVSLFDGEKHLAVGSPLQIEEMVRKADIQRDMASAATIQQGQILAQEIHKPPTQYINIYISSAPEDEELLKELLKQLSMLERQPDIHLWKRQLILAGMDRGRQISRYVNQAHLILFLVSPDFLASDQCYEEIKLATERESRGEISVVPLLMRHTADWQATPLDRFEPLPTDRQPISDRVDREKTMCDIAEHIRYAVEQIRQNLPNKKP